MARAATVKGNHKLFENEGMMITMRLVIKIGGSLLFDENQQLDVQRFQQYAQVIREILSKGHDLMLVVGGGVLAKTLVAHGDALGADTASKDRLGIAATWVCAQLMIAAIGESTFPTPIMSETQLLQCLETEKLLVMGGLQPGQSTNAVAARVAELTKTKIILNVTDVDGVFESDPKDSDQAQLLPVVTVDKLRQIVSSLESKPGTYPLFDKVALDIVERADIEVWFVNGQDPNNIKRAIQEKMVGTRLLSQ